MWCRARRGSLSASRGEGTTADTTLPGVWVQCSVVVWCRARGGSPSASRGDGTTADTTLPGVWV